MSRDIPFFEMFTELRLSAPLRLKLAGAELTGACIDQTAMTITVHLRVRMPLSPEDEEQIRQSLCAVYGFAKAEMDVTCVEQPAAAKVSARRLRPLGQAGREAASPPERS
ncbi:MAG: hypothetical protein V8R55_01245 [Dysosmobacter sp.]